MQSFNEYETESKRLTVLNQRFAFLMNGLNYVKLRQASTKDLIYDAMEKRLFTTLEGLLRAEIDNLTPDQTSPQAPKTPTKLGLI